jgi:hypothetical protein
MFEQSTLNTRKTICLEFQNEYDFDIKHIKGKENKVVDELSRRVHKMNDTTISKCRKDLKDSI